MKSGNYKVLTDSTGKECRFNSNAFYDAVLNKKRVCNSEARKTKRMTVQTLIDQIASEAGVSFDAVNNWYRGYNGPSDYESVIAAAKVLDIPESALVIPVSNEKKVVREMSIKEKELVANVFGKCVEVFYEYADQDENVLSNKELITQIERRNARREVHKEFVRKVSTFHGFIDSNTLIINSSWAYVKI